MHKATSRDLPIEQKSLGLSCTCRVVLVLFMSVIFRSPPVVKRLREYMSRKVKEGEAEIRHLGRNNLWMAYFSRSKNAKTYISDSLAEKHLAGHPAASGQLSTRPTRATSRSSSLLVRCMTCPKIRPRATDTFAYALGPGLLCIS